MKPNFASGLLLALACMFVFAAGSGLAAGLSRAELTFENATVAADPEVIAGGAVLLYLEARQAARPVICKGQTRKHCRILRPGDTVSVVAELQPVDADDTTPIVAELAIRYLPAP